MGFFAGLTAEKYDRQYPDSVLVRRILDYFRPHRKRLITIAILVLLVSSLGALMPVVVSRGVDQMRGHAQIPSIALIASIVLLIGVTNWSANWLRRRTTVRAIADVVVKMASDAFAAAAEHDLSFYDDYSSGRVVSRITSDTQEFGNLVSLVTDVVQQLVESVAISVILISIDWRLALAIFAIVPVIFLMALSYRQLARNITRKGMQATANVNSTIKETVSGIAIAKNFRQETGIYNDFNQVNTLSYRVNVRRGIILSLVFPSLNAIGGMASGTMVYLGGLSAVHGAVTAGAWYLFILSIDRFMFPVMNLSSFWTQVQSGLSASERVFALIDAEKVVIQSDNQPAPRLAGLVEFKHLYFHYKINESILKDFNLTINAGETVALVGHTGAGKSSIARLIARFYEFQGGQIAIDGQDIRSFDLTSYRQQLGIVSQTPFLFSETVADNIRYGCPEVTDREIEEIGRQIGEGEWLETLPKGLGTEVGERGSRLSMGQRQLVSLMRVLVQKPAIFILDEATASIDPFTEWQIQQALNLILSRTTSILIAHRLSTVKSADRIIVMEKGKIIEEGNHENLLAAGGHYAGLYNTYFRHQSADFIPSGIEGYLSKPKLNIS